MEENKPNQLAIIQTNPITELFSLKEITKESITNIVNQILGKGFSIKDLAMVNALKELIKQLDEAIRNNLNPLELGKSGDSYKGIKIELGKSPTKYNYCDDDIYKELKEKADQIKEEMDARQNFLKDQYKVATSPQNVGKSMDCISIESASQDIFKITIKK